MIFTYGYIDGYRAEVFLDCGATISILSSKFENQHNISIRSSDINIRTANNNIIPVIEETKILPVNIHGHICDLFFVILEHDDHECLLGLDWFKATRASINPASKSLRFESETIFLSQNGSMSFSYNYR